MNTRAKDYIQKATFPAVTGAPEPAASGSNAKSVNYSKSHFNLATWNTRTLLPPESLALLASKLKSLNIHVTCIEETRFQGSPSIPINDVNDCPSYKRYCSGYDHKQGLHGVGIDVETKFASHVMEWIPMGPRLCYIRIQAKPTPLSIICCYAPTEDKANDINDEFFKELSKLMGCIPKKDVIIVAGDFNAKIGERLSSESANIGRFATGDRNNNGGQLISFAMSNNLVVSNTTFQKPAQTLPTWISNDGITRNQIDFILISRRLRSVGQKNCLFQSDHKMLKAKMKVKLKVYTKTPKCFRQDVNALRTPKVAESFRKELALKLEKLPSGSDVNCCWNGIKEALATSAEKCIPKKKPIRNPWISRTTLELIAKRNRARTTKSKKNISREIKRQVRIDKNRFYESTTDDIITAEEHGNTRCTMW